jgi:hypothetical protein
MAKSLWLSNGSLVLDADGAAVLCEDCPCEDGNICKRCWVNAEVEWLLTLSGLSTCDGFNINGSYVLQKTGSSTDPYTLCGWLYDGGTHPTQIELTFDRANNHVILQIRGAGSGAGAVNYSKSLTGTQFDEFPCDQSFALDLLDAFACAAIWPSTLTVHPNP